MWSSSLMIIGVDRLSRVLIFDLLGGKVTQWVQADHPDTPESMKGFLHYLYLTVSEIVASCLTQPLYIAQTFKEIHLSDCSTWQAYKKVKAIKSPYDGLSARIIHNLASRITSELLWTALAQYCSPRYFLRPLPLVPHQETLAQQQQDARLRNPAAIYREALRSRAIERWRRYMWFSFLRGIANAATNILTLPLHTIQSQMLAQGLSFNTSNTTFSSFFHALSSLSFSSSPSLLTSLKGSGFSLLIDSAVCVITYSSGCVFVNILDAWAPISYLEALQ